MSMAATIPDNLPHAEPASPTGAPADRRSRAAAIMDPGWLFVLSGATLIGAAMVIPALDALAEARYLRDRALAVEAQRADRITRHEELLEGLHARDAVLSMSLAASQLNQIPSDRRPLPGTGLDGESLGLADASVFPSLEPVAISFVERRQGQSMLERLILNPKTGVWVGLIGAVCILIGLLPRATRA
jgi:hypothetical protein